MDDFVVLGLLVVGVVIGGFSLGIIGFFKAQRLERSLYEIKRQLSALNVVAPRSEPASEIAISKAELKQEIAAEPVVPKIETITEAPIGPILAPTAIRHDLERNLASRWFVWVGGVAVALAGLLFIKYAHDQGLISPFLRILIGLLIAAGLVVAGEYVRRSRGTSMVDYVPAALSAAGLVMGFGVVYAAYGLYDLVSPGVDFIGLGLVALAAFWLSRVQGPLIAALGLLGAYSAPALVTATHPNAWSFFPYLLNE